MAYLVLSWFKKELLHPGRLERRKNPREARC